MSTPGERLEALGREARARLGSGRDSATRVYRGRTIAELVPQIERELGAEAIIVSRREGVTDGVLGFFRRTFVEIEAMSDGAGAAPQGPAKTPAVASRLAPAGAERGPAVAQGPAAERPAPATAPLPSAAQRPPAVRSTPVTPQRAPLGYKPDATNRLATGRPRVGSLGPPPASPAATPRVAPPPFLARERPAPPAPGASAYVTAHLAALARADRPKARPRASTPERRDDEGGWAPKLQAPAPRVQPEPSPAPVERVPTERVPTERVPAERAPTERVPTERVPAERAPAPQPPAPARRVVATGSPARARVGVARTLQRCGISEELANELIDGACAHALALAPRAGLAQAVRATLAQRIPVAPALPSTSAAIVVVGAGGAGKTTCCAALLDAYRRGSSLSASYATIVRSTVDAADGEQDELQMILSPHLMKPAPASGARALRALRKARNGGVTLIDTPGFSPADRGGVRELAGLLAELAPERVVVALPATLGAAAAAQLLEALRPLGANAVALTHADETDQIGVAVEAACRFDLAPEYMLEHARAGWRLRQLAPSALAERLLP